MPATTSSWRFPVITSTFIPKHFQNCFTTFEAATLLPPDVTITTPPSYKSRRQGFRPVTRLALGDPGLWKAILDQNAGPVLKEIKQFKKNLGQFEKTAFWKEVLTNSESS